jgi:hypothetical protein
MMGTHRIGEYSKMIDLETVHLMKGGDELEERYGIKRGPFSPMWVGWGRGPSERNPKGERPPLLRYHKSCRWAIGRIYVRTLTPNRPQARRTP